MDNAKQEELEYLREFAKDVEDAMDNWFTSGGPTQVYQAVQVLKFNKKITDRKIKNV